MSSEEEPVVSSLVGSYGKCAAPDCENNGKLKCAACSAVAYCSHACQKKHWAVHKNACKSLKTGTGNLPQQPQSASPQQPQPQQVQQQQKPQVIDVGPNGPALQTLKQEIQRHFNMGDFDNAIKKSEDALNLAKTLPPMIAISETIQLHINLSTAFVHLNRPKDSEEHASQAVKIAESGVAQAPPGAPQPLEVLSISLGCKSVAFLANQKVDEALDLAQRSLAIAEKIYPKNDPRLHKSLRTVAMILDKKGNTTEAEKTLIRAYTIICLAGGPQTGEAQLITEDLVGIFTRKGDLETAEKHARKNYQSMKERPSLQGVENAVLADSATRLANCLARQTKHSAAEEYVVEALEIRNRPEFANMNPIGMAFSLTQLAAIRDALGKLDQDCENMLMRALDIFTRTKGPNSPEAMNTLAQLKNVRSKRKGAVGGSSSSGNKSGVSVDDASDDDYDEPKFPVAKGKNSTGTAPKKNNNTVKSSSSSAGGAVEDVISAEDQKKIDALQPSNGIMRMQLAQHFFEQQRFAAAECVLQQAFNIFLQQNGPEHEHTKAAKQNLLLVRNNRLNQLWMQVVTEEVLKLEELKISDDGESDSKKHAASSSSTKAQKDEDEFRKMMSGKLQIKDSPDLNLEEKLFLSSLDNDQPQSNCVVC